MPPERPPPEEVPRNDADTAGVRVPSESFPDQDGPEPSRTRQKPTVQSDKHFFGIKQDPPSSGFVFNDDYDKRFPDDPYCQETSAPNAKVWRVYVEEAAAYDANMVGRYRDGLDVMLVFAGLFSAVVTSFLVQASQNLQADYGEMTAILLHDLVFIQLAIADGASVVNITSPSANPAAPFVANGIDILVNGFWVVSLSASLAVALAAVLVKQWLHHYMSLHSGTSRHRSHVRHFRFTGLERWHVRIIIGMLPIIMHLSLILFLSGLILFFVPLHASLAWAVGTITVILCALYFISNALPIVYPRCPYQTPLSDFLNYSYHVTLLLWYAVRRAVERLLQFSRYLRYLPWGILQAGGHSFQSLRSLEDLSVRMAYNEVSVDALDWLYTVSSNPVVQRTAIMAIGGLPASVQQYAASTWHDPRHMRFTRSVMLRESTQKVKDDDLLACLPGSESTLERVFRSYLFLPNNLLTYSNSRILDTGNARFDLALAITPMGRRTPMQIRELFNTSHEIAVHPLVWSELVALAASNGAFRLSDPNVTAGAHAQFAASMLPDSSLLPLKHDTLSPRKLRRALQVCPPPAIWDYFLQMPVLRAFDVGPLSSLSTSLRALLAAANFALHHIDEGHTLPDVDFDDSSLASEAQSHWILLEVVLNYLGSTCPFMDELPLEVMQLMDQIVLLEAFRCFHSPDHTSVPIHLLDGCMSSILTLCITYAARKPSYPPRPIHSTMLHISMSRLQYTLDSLSYTVTQQPMDHASFWSLVQLADSLMAVALSSGQHEAYHLFVQDQWMRRLGPLWIAGWPELTRREWTITDYVSGLASPSMAVARQQFIDHLYEPENLAIAVCVVFTDARALWSLIALDPTHLSWDRCRALMDSITIWNHSPDCGTTEFPGDYLLGSKVIQWSNLSSSLEELIRKRFTGEKVGEQLDMATQILNESLTLNHG